MPIRGHPPGTGADTGDSEATTAKSRSGEKALISHAFRCLSAPSRDARRAAMERLTDQRVLADVAKTDNELDARNFAISLSTTELVSVSTL